MSIIDAIGRVKKYLDARVPGGLRSDHIHGMNGNSPLLVSDLRLLLETLDQPQRVLKKREQDVLKVYPIIWESIFGGYLYKVDQASGILRSTPDDAQEILEGLREDLVKMREFLMYGDTSTDEKGPQKT